MDRDNRRLVRHAIVVVALTFVISCWIAFLVFDGIRLRPPAGVTSLEEFARRMPPPRHLYLIDISGRQYLAWIGDTANPIALSSGPAAYAFDSAGNLLAWTPDVGDAHGLRILTDRTIARKDITLEEALALVERTP